MTQEVPRLFVDGLGDLNLDPTPAKPQERVWSAVVPIDAVVHIAGFIGQQRNSIESIFAEKEMQWQTGSILDLAVKMTDLTDMHQGMYDGTMRATKSDLLLLRDIKRHTSHLDISKRERELFERSYRDIIRPFRKEFLKERKPSNTRVWLEVMNPFNGLNSVEKHPE